MTKSELKELIRKISNAYVNDDIYSVEFWYDSRYVTFKYIDCDTQQRTETELELKYAKKVLECMRLGSDKATTDAATEYIRKLLADVHKEVAGSYEDYCGLFAWQKDDLTSDELKEYVDTMSKTLKNIDALLEDWADKYVKRSRYCLFRS